MPNKEYPNFATLAASHKEGIDFERLSLPQLNARVAVLAPHGGKIEPYTDSIAKEIAKDDFSLYCFCSKRPKAEANLHITSHNFDDPDCISLVSEHQWAVAIHGCKNDGEQVFLGGLDKSLIADFADKLRTVGIKAETTGHKYPGTNLKNICNRTKTGVGVQFELSLKFRKNSSKAQLFVQAVRAVLLNRQNAATI